MKRARDLKPLYARVLVGMTFSGWLATLAGWYTTEIGRQPYLVYGVLKTADAASSTPAPIVGISLAAYLAVYAVLIVAFMTTLFYMARQAGKKKLEEPVASSKAIAEAVD